MAKQFWETQGFLRSFVEQAPVALAVLDSEFNYIVVSDKWLSDYDLKTDIVGRSHYDVFPDLPEKWRAVHSKALAGETQTGDEDPYIDASGGKHWLNWQVRPWLMPDGRMGGIVILTEDVTQKCRAREDLAAAQHYMRKVLDTIPFELVVIDRSGVIRLANLTWDRFGNSRDPALNGTWIGTNYLEAVRRASATDSVSQQVVEGIESVLSGQPSYSLEYECQTENEAQWYLMIAVPILTENERGAVITHADITERKRLERELIRAGSLRAIGELSRGLASDLGNLLTVISGNLQLARMELHGTSEKVETYLTDALNAAERGAATSKHLSALAATRDRKRTSVAVDGIVARTSEILKRTLGKRFHVQREVPSDLWWALIDQWELESVLINLSLNVRDAMPDGGRLLMLCRNLVVAPKEARHIGIKDGHFVCIRLLGMGDWTMREAGPRASEPVLRTDDIDLGLGLGLASVSRILDGCGGALKTDFGFEDGISVDIYLPRGEPLSSQSAPQKPGRLGSGGLVLVVADDANVRQVGEQCVEAQGYRAISLPSAAEAIALLQGRSEVLLILSDAELSGEISGRDLRRWVKAQRPEIAVVLTSGTTVTGFEEGEGEPVLRRPFTHEELGRALASALHDL